MSQLGILELEGARHLLPEAVHGAVDSASDLSSFIAFWLSYQCMASRLYVCQVDRSCYISPAYLLGELIATTLQFPTSLECT